jgi:transposase
MSTDASHPLIPASGPSATNPTVVVVVANQGPVDSGIRLPVERVALDELQRRQQAEHPHRSPADEPAAPLPNNVSVLQNMVVELRQALADYKQRLTEVEQGMDALLRRRHRSPADPWPANQLPLFPELATPDPATPDPATLPDTTPPEVEPATETAPSPKKQTKGHGRRSLEELLRSLPCVRREHPLTEAECLCPCCSRPRRKIGEQTSQQLEYIPAKLVCVQHVQFTYSCPQCPEHITTAPKPPQPINRGLAGPGLLALVAASKFDDYLPLYRQELTLSRAGLFLARSTLCDWLTALGTLVRPLVERMKADIFASRVVSTDGTSIDVLLEGERQAKTGYFWPYLGDEAHPHVVVDFSLDKRKEHPQRFLADYQGYVQVDAYSAYNGCFLANEDIGYPKSEVGCWSHAERYFEAARDSDPIRAAEALGFVRSLFALEARAKREHLAETEVLALRQREAVPILDEFKTWLERTRPQVLPKSPLADALRYTLNQWEALRRYSDTGFLSLDNNATERINKLIARGRVNWLFVGSPRSGETAARLLSLVVTCRRLQMDSFLYLRDVFTRLPGLPAERLDELLPQRWLAEHPEARYPPQRQSHGHADPQPRRHRRHRHRYG